MRAARPSGPGQQRRLESRHRRARRLPALLEHAVRGRAPRRRRRSVGSSPDADAELAWAHPAHVCTATAPTAATSALGASRSTQEYSRGNSGVLKGYPRGAQAGQCFLSGNDVCDAKASKEAVKKMLDHGGISYIATTVGSVGVAHVATACYALQRCSARCNSMLQPRCTHCNGAVRDAARRIPRETVPRHQRHARSATPTALRLRRLDCRASTPVAQCSWHCSTRSRHSGPGPGGLFARAERESNRLVNAASEWVAPPSTRPEWEVALRSGRGLPATGAAALVAA